MTQSLSSIQRRGKKKSSDDVSDSEHGSQASSDQFLQHPDHLLHDLRRHAQEEPNHQNGTGKNRVYRNASTRHLNERQQQRPPARSGYRPRIGSVDESMRENIAAAHAVKLRALRRPSYNPEVKVRRNLGRRGGALKKYPAWVPGIDTGGATIDYHQRSGISRGPGESKLENKIVWNGKDQNFLLSSDTDDIRAASQGRNGKKHGVMMAMRMVRSSRESVLPERIKSPNSLTCKMKQGLPGSPLTPTKSPRKHGNIEAHSPVGLSATFSAGMLSSRIPTISRLLSPKMKSKGGMVGSRSGSSDADNRSANSDRSNKFSNHYSKPSPRKQRVKNSVKGHLGEDKKYQHANTNKLMNGDRSCKNSSPEGQGSRQSKVSSEHLWQLRDRSMIDNTFFIAFHLKRGWMS
eukprot:CAMPEP_0184482828 /NCGR_PEP_ID=MMETSP0113_2-20130426/4423_1 /TAXON_ID=91329 /ORGANISM="Norrisiella sphaerica, Strain BC52" /LENGTH=404 /DNA_ID=CAMNT_0026862825 /DNA_START=104 /DNA_END=1318 /DNA_ORIENTATION=-